MSVTGLPTNAGVNILAGDLKNSVKRFALFGTDSSSSNIQYSESSTLSSLNSYLIGKFNIARSYFDDNGTLTFECPIPYDFSSTKWVSACGLVYVDGSGAETLVAISPMPKFQKTEGIGGTVHFKVPIAGQAGTLIFEEMPYTTRQELDTVLNELYTGMSAAVDQAGLANREIIKNLIIRNQSGEVIIYNRGIISGCTASKSTNATRNISLAGGSIFMGGRILAIPDMPNTANVPQNTTSATQYTYLYLWIDANGIVQVDCTDLGATPPSDSISLYKIAVPANNTEATDPYLANCTLTDIRRVEANYPTMLSTAPFTYVALQYPFPNADYIVNFDILDFQGSGFQLGYCYVGDRATNGFSIYLNGTVDKVRLKYKVNKNNV